MKKSELATATAETFRAWCWELARKSGGITELLELAYYCFNQWQSQRRSERNKTRINVDLRGKNQRLTERNRVLSNELRSQKYFCSSERNHWHEMQAISKTQWIELSSKYAQLQAENQQLKQQLATQLVPVPNNPGMAFISYPN